MRIKFLESFLVVILLIMSLSGFSQESVAKPDALKAIIDSLKQKGIVLQQSAVSPEIKLSYEQALKLLQNTTKPNYWVNHDDPFRKALNRLVFEASSERFDSIDVFLRKYPYDSISISWDKFYIWEPLNFKVPVIPMPVSALRTDSIPADSIPSVTADSTIVKEEVERHAVEPSIQDVVEIKPVSTMKDTTIMVIRDTLYIVTSNKKDFPFKYLNNPYQSDSIRVAVLSLLEYLQQRDSSIVHFVGSGREPIPVWVNTKGTGTVRRYWLRNEFDDSVTVWIGSAGRNRIGLYLEQGISFRKPMKQSNYSQARIDMQRVDRSTLEKQNIIVKTHYWRYRTESSMAFSQSALSNWVKGGENSVSTALDITGYADFKNPETKLTSSNFARLKLGFLASGGEDIRKNLDLLETNSKLNHKAFGKFDFSAIMLFKTQIAAGKTYAKVDNRDTSYVVSRFFNPATITLGVGLDYKPNKKTSINFSPLSYKATFVPAAGKITKDSLLYGKIDQTRYGVDIGKKSKHEPGASFMLSKVSNPVKNVTITNRLQLFTNYIKNPLNIDVDWEMIAVYNLNWFTDLRLNTHLIFDDDTHTTVMKGGAPVLLDDGSEKKTARIQFKEIFGVALMFKF